MKVVAHPLVVAVALGLLGPGALAEGRDDDDVTAGHSLPGVHSASESIDPDELARVERAWLDARDEVG